MKKLFIFLGLIGFSFLNVGLIAQPTIVSTTPTTRNVILEEFTGSYCSYCPDGHKRCNDLKNIYQDRFHAINIHCGYLSIARFQTTDGTTLASYFKVKSFPSGIVNRNSDTAINRGYWASITSNIINQPSCMNVAAEGTIDWATRTLSLLVEVYYTDSSVVDTNFLTVALLQNNIASYQAGATTYNRTQMLPDNYNYRHNHVLRDIISPTWGDTILTTDSGAFFSKTYTYSIPANINNLTVDLGDLEVLAYVSESQKDVITGAKAHLSHINVTDRNARLISFYKENNFSTCTETSSEVCLMLKNTGMDTINKVDIKASGNYPNVQQHVLNRQILPGDFDTINMKLEGTINQNNQYSILLASLNNDNPTNPYSGFNYKYNHATVEMKNEVTINLFTDAYASGTSISILDPDGNIVLKDTNFENLTAAGITKRSYTFTPEKLGCYILRVVDGNGSGINKGYGTGYIEIIDQSGNQIYHHDGKFFYIAQCNLNVTNVGISENSLKSISVFPNPAKEILYIESEDDIQQIEIFNLLGQKLSSESNTSQISVSNLSTGMYVISIKTEKGNLNQKFIKE